MTENIKMKTVINNTADITEAEMKLREYANDYRKRKAFIVKNSVSDNEIKEGL